MKNIVYKMLSAIVTLAVLIGCITIGTGTVFAATAPWTKNENGQFVNGNGDIIKGATMKGIDVSHYNGNIDWKTVAESDIDYAYTNADTARIRPSGRYILAAKCERLRR